MAPQSPTAARKSTRSGRKVEVSLQAPEATRVVVAGDFNGWQADGHPLKRNKQGLWKTNLHLPPGTYQYRFLVDEVWCEDPGCRTRVDNTKFG